jgi:hypothetical protein
VKELNRVEDLRLKASYRILSSTVHEYTLFAIENVDKILPAHFTLKVVEKGFKIKGVMLC